MVVPPVYMEPFETRKSRNNNTSLDRNKIEIWFLISHLLLSQLSRQSNGFGPMFGKMVVEYKNALCEKHSLPHVLNDHDF